MTVHNEQFTAVPNVMFDLMPHISMAQFSVLMTIARKTYGWQKLEDTISLSQFSKATGLSTYGVRLAIQEMVNRGFVARRQVGKQNHAYTIMLPAITAYLAQLYNSVAQSDGKLYNSVAQSDTEPCNSVAQLHEKPCNSVAPQKKPNTKEKTFKETGVPSSFLGPNEQISQTMEKWQTIVGNISKADKSTLRTLCAKHGVPLVCGAIDKARAAGKVEGLGFVRWVLENAPNEVVAKAPAKGGILEYKAWLLREFNMDNADVIAMDEGITTRDLYGKYERYKIAAQGYVIKDAPDLASFLASV